MTFFNFVFSLFLLRISLRNNILRMCRQTSFGRVPSRDCECTICVTWQVFEKRVFNASKKEKQSFIVQCFFLALV